MITSSHPPLTLVPDPASWPRLVRAHKPPPAALTFRREIGLPDDRPVLFSGHQAELWHPGILAKLFALDSLARSINAFPAWVVVDQDANEPGLIRYPTTRDGSLAHATWRLSRELATTTDIPTSMRPPIDHAALRAGWEGSPAATGPIACQLTLIAGALKAHADERSLASQFTLAAADLLAGIVPFPFALPASSLSRTSLFASLLDRIASDPAACIATYNDAAQRFPASGIRTLSASRSELPLWRLRPGMPRQRVTAASLPTIPPEQLAPRALLMTGLLRYAAADLFIHGLGGGAYDPVTEHWLQSWLGWSLAPAVVASATLTLPLSSEQPADPAEALRARWRAHHARHQPAELGDHWAHQRKAELLDEIASSAGDRRAAARAFEQLQLLLANYRKEHAPQLAELDRLAHELHRRAQQGRVALDRTWPFPLHAKDALLALAEAVRQRCAP